MEEKIQGFVEQLANFKLTGNTTTNQYSYDCPMNAIRRHNLTLYLSQMARRRPRSLLVAEAPGYRGMRLTGVPFVSPLLVRTGLDSLDLFGVSRGYQAPLDYPEIQKEQSSTIVWQTLLQIGYAPLIWCAVPFHPYEPGNPLSNRPPSASDLQAGIGFLREMIALFAPKQILAVGNYAHQSLLRLNLNCEKIRHPAQSGKPEFVAGIKRLLQVD